VYLAETYIIGNVLNERKINILSYGINHYRPNKKTSIHAEHDAINKLPSLKKRKKLEKINILVIRITKNGKLGMSKPCSECVNKLKMLPPKNGYKINEIYYSTERESIHKIKLNNNF